MTRFRLFLQVTLGLIVFAVFGLPAPASAAAPGLQVHPLHYRDTLAAGHIKTGFVDVANPGDSPVVIETTVRGFRQTGAEGELEFYEDSALSAGIKVDLTGFELGPREAIRVGFNVDPAKLPGGGVYAAIFFRTVPPAQSAGSSYVAESANVGTLLEFTNGPAGPHQGDVSALQLPFWQFGRGLTGRLSYRNTDRSAHPVGFRPNLSVQVLPWASKPKLNTALVLPGSTRSFEIRRLGSYFGPLPVTITDQDTRRTITRWVFACTGWYQWAVLVLTILLIVTIAIRPRRLMKGLRHLARYLKRRKKPVKRPLDGLSPKSKS